METTVSIVLYICIRNVIVHTVINSYHKTNQFWPYYDASTGDGKVIITLLYYAGLYQFSFNSDHRLPIPHVI